MYPFEYVVESYRDENTEFLHGVTFANSYREAAEFVEDYYGETLVSMKLFCCEECCVYEFESADGILKNVRCGV